MRQPFIAQIHLSLLQRKITNALLYHAYKELMLKEEHEITVKQFCRLIGYKVIIMPRSKMHSKV